MSAPTSQTLGMVLVRHVATQLEADQHEPGHNPFSLLFEGPPYRKLLIETLDFITIGMIAYAEEFLKKRP